MTTRPVGSLLNFWEHVPDPRGRHGQRHPLAAMLAASICAILSGFHGDTAMAQWIHLQDVSLWHLLGFTRRPPGHDCFRDVLMAVDPDALAAWIDGEIKRSVSCAVTSLSREQVDAATLLKLWRGRWDIENRLF